MKSRRFDLNDLKLKLSRASALIGSGRIDRLAGEPWYVLPDIIHNIIQYNIIYNIYNLLFARNMKPKPKSER